MSLGEVGWGEGGVGSGGCLVLVGAVAFGLAFSSGCFKCLGTGRLRVAVRLLLLLVRQDGGPGNPHRPVMRELIVGLNDVPGALGNTMSFNCPLRLRVGDVVEPDISFSEKEAIPSNGSAALARSGVRGDPDHP